MRYGSLRINTKIDTENTYSEKYKVSQNIVTETLHDVSQAGLNQTTDWHFSEMWNILFYKGSLMVDTRSESTKTRLAKHKKRKYW